MARQPRAAAELVVEQQAGADVGALPDPLGERVAGTAPGDEVRRDHVQQQAALAQRLAHEAELQLLEVAQAAVDQLARARRRAGGEVARLDQRHRQTARGGVERAARPRHPAADDEHVERLLAHPGERGLALRGIQARQVSSWGGGA